jgi:hypothetical protein
LGGDILKEEILYNVQKYIAYVIQELGGKQHSWLRPYATSWKVAGSILNEVIGFFN